MANYGAFISYSHAKDKPIAAALQSAVQEASASLGTVAGRCVSSATTPVCQQRPICGQASKRLSLFRFFLLMASPEAGASKWVSKEVAWWLDHNNIETLLFGVTDGDLAWDQSVGDFTQCGRFPLPPILAGRFEDEPKWVDLRPRDKADPRNADFTSLAADFASAIQGRPKEDLLSEEVLQQRRALRLAWSAAGALTVLTFATTLAGVAAYLSRQGGDHAA